ncbi:MAG: energy-coupling factor ABC transporter permease [Anaerosomatales bacterium]|nr:energy-coupling factor ABC transporter permease [Anaerosomatales bacterium]
MHIPDGMLDTKTWATAWVGSAGALAYAARRVRQAVDDSRLVLMSVIAALIFALQMLNFPVAGGTSGHFAGGAAAAILLGPWQALLVMAGVLGVQALFFADGGITAFGANVVNMGVVAVFVGWAVYRAASGRSPSPGRRSAAAFAAGWAGCFVASLFAALELWISGRAPLLAVVSAMGFWHAVIGIGEGLITAGLVAYLAQTRPGLLDADAPASASSVRPVAVTLGAVALAAAGLSFLASSHPDGLEYVYFEQGIGRPFAERVLLHSPMPDYVIPGVANETLAGVLAGAVGVVITGALLYTAVRALAARRQAA